MKSTRVHWCVRVALAAGDMELANAIADRLPPGKGRLDSYIAIEVVRGVG